MSVLQLRTFVSNKHTLCVLILLGRIVVIAKLVIGEKEETAQVNKLPTI